MLGRGNVWSSPRVVVRDPGKPPPYARKVPYTAVHGGSLRPLLLYPLPRSPTTECHLLITLLPTTLPDFVTWRCPFHVHFMSQDATAHSHAAPTRTLTFPSTSTPPNPAHNGSPLRPPC